MVQTISILGCTGSIGRQTAAVAEYTGIRVAALTANRQIDRLEEQARKFKPEFVAVYDENAAKELKIALSDTDIRVGSGMEGLLEAATLQNVDCVVTAVKLFQLTLHQKVNCVRVCPWRFLLHTIEIIKRCV